jgi:uncharacterized small protein (DUF1192 family)
MTGGAAITVAFLRHKVAEYAVLSREIERLTAEVNQISSTAADKSS